MRAVADDLGRVAEQRAERDERRHGRRRRQEQHRHEHDLGRADQPRAEREADAPDERVTDDEQARPRPSRRSPAVAIAAAAATNSAAAVSSTRRSRGVSRRVIAGPRRSSSDSATAAAAPTVRLKRDHHLQGVSAAAGSPWAGSRMHREGAELVESRAGVKRVRALTLSQAEYHEPVRRRGWKRPLEGALPCAGRSPQWPPPPLSVSRSPPLMRARPRPSPSRTTRSRPRR